MRYSAYTKHHKSNTEKAVNLYDLKAHFCPM
jgi:hypothetical protein